jgi:hypothetical protein
MFSRIFSYFCIVLVAVCSTGCSSLLPKAESETEAPWKTFADAKHTYDRIEPGHTTLDELKQLGFDPYGNRNVTVLHFSDIVAKYAPSSIRDEYLEPGIRECLQMQTSCNAYSIEHRQIHRDRVGNFFLDFINYRRRTEITGWRFAAVIVIVGDRVVYKSWSGVPEISEVEQTTNPLGPLQDSGPALLRP